MKNGNPPHDKQDLQVHLADIKIGMQYNELCEVRFIELYFKVGKLKTLVQCLKKILTQSFCLVNAHNCFLHVVMLPM